MTILDLPAELHALTPATRVLTGADVDGYAVAGMRPAAVVKSGSVDEVRAVLRLTGERGLTVTPWGGGTVMDLGNPPARLDLIMDLSRLNRIIEHRPRDLTVTVEAGITLGALAAVLREHGQMLALDPPRMDRATVGGVLAANSTGPRRQRYGTARDLLIGSRSVLADGTLIRSGGKVVKNVAGYDLNKLLIGSLGTIAVIVEATLRVTPLAVTSGLHLAAFATCEAAQAAALAILRARLQPLTLDLISPRAAQGLASASRTALPNGWLLAVEYGGSAAAVERTARDVAQLATAGGASGLIVQEREQHEALLGALRNVGRGSPAPAALILRAGVLPSETAEAVRVLEAAAGEPPAIIVRAGVGVVYGYWERADDALAVIQSARAGIAGLGGTVTVERAPLGVAGVVDAWGLTGADVALMRRVKEAYDPGGVLSPGRLV